MDKQYDHKLAEQQAQQLWHKEKTYAPENNPGPLYSIDTPPPTVSGSLHIGHVFSYTQTDIIARFERMSGKSVFYPMGFDDNGLATERFVEKTIGIEGYTLKRSEFIKLCLEQTAKSEKDFESLWQRIGLSVDWSALYSTIDERSQKISQESFLELYKKGFIYRKNEPALYCTTCRTTVAQAELDDLEKATTFNDIIFMCGDEKLIVATTRPELLPSTQALLYHPEDSRYKHLKGKTARVPVWGQEVPIYADPDAIKDKGTGLVMVSTFGDKQDIVWAKRYNLPFKQSVGIDGKWTDITRPLTGMRVASARTKAIELLKDAGLLGEQKPIQHSVNVHERCKKEIEYLVLPQWFLSIMPHKETFIEYGDKIEWYPAFMKTRYKNWVENISWDWCLSRQRFYGIPFPVWHCKACNEIILADAKQLPIDPQETPYNGTCPTCKSSDIKPDTDVMDTWNTSSLTPYIVKSLYTKNTDVFVDTDFIPMSMRPQAHDIIRTWAFYTIIKSYMHQQTIPWKKIVISGHVLSSEKEKISKSRGNATLTPEGLLTDYPADAIRFWTASGSLGYDMAFSDNQLAIGQKLLVKLWNAFKFAHQYLDSYTPIHEKPAKLGLVNEWILTRSSKAFERYQHYFAQHEFSLALQQIDQFFWHDYCDNYIELVKDQLNNQDHPEYQATLWTLHTVGLRILQLYAPFIPHITETVYQLMFKQHEGTASIHQTKFNAYQQPLLFANAQDMDVILELIGHVRKLKTEKQLSLKTELESLTVYSTDSKIMLLLQSQEGLIKGITKAHAIAYMQKNLDKPAMLEKDGKWHASVGPQVHQNP